jgi:hypothetical protein
LDAVALLREVANLARADASAMGIDLPSAAATATAGGSGSGSAVTPSKRPAAGGANALSPAGRGEEASGAAIGLMEALGLVEFAAAVDAVREVLPWARDVSKVRRQNVAGCCDGSTWSSSFAFDPSLSPLAPS